MLDVKLKISYQYGLTHTSF